MTHPYASLEYACAFGSDYEPIFLEEARTFVLKRRIPGTTYFDAMGPYPVTPLAFAADLERDFAALRRSGMVSLTLVTDPFFHPPASELRRCFDYVRPYKEHFICDFSKPRSHSKHHAYEVRRATKRCQTRTIALMEYLDEWCGLYRTLMERHRIVGVSAFSSRYFTALAGLKPVMIGAFADGRLVAAHLWFAQDQCGYSHLAASSTEGYHIRASYAVYDHSIRHLAESGIKLIDLGGGAGAAAASPSLVNMKRGFSNASCHVYLCGKILSESRYTQLSVNSGSGYFPAYRSPSGGSAG